MPPSTGRLRVLAALVVAGCVVGLAAALVHSTSYRAHASFVLRPALRTSGAQLETLTRTAAGLVKSDTVASNVIASLHLSDSNAGLLGDLSTSVRPGTAIVDIAVRRGTAVQAQQVAQEVLVVFEGIARARFGTTTAIQTWDAPGSGTSAVGKPYVADALLGASGGLLLGVLGLLALAWRARPRPLVAAPVAPVRDVEPEPEVVSDTVVEPEPEPTPEPAPATGLLGDLERRARDEPDPVRREELAAYLDQFRGFADVNGELPANLLPLVEDVFGV
jgi:capsular polysaccharide biosynthesis protein